MANRTCPTADTTPYLNRLNAWDHDDLQAVAKYVIGLEAHPGWQALTRLVDEVHADAWSNVIGGHSGARGRVLEQAEYACTASSPA